jgi:phage tail tape-measure protein
MKRPLETEKAKATSGTANNPGKSNVLVNEQAKVFGLTGNIMLAHGMYQSASNIMNSPDPVQETVSEAGGWAGALAAGTVGAEAGAYFGPWGSLIGGLVGGAAGGYFGKDAVENFANPRHTPPFVDSPIKGTNTNKHANIL